MDDSRDSALTAEAEFAPEPRPAPKDAPFRHGKGPAPKDPYQRIVWAAARGQGTTLKPEDVQMMAGDTAIREAATGDGLDDT